MADILRINASLLAHIGADADIAGSGYEGNVFQNTTGYLSQYLETLPADTTDHLVTLKTQLNALAMREKNRLLATKPFFNEDNYSQYITNLSDEVKGLTVGQSLLIPGGWEAKPSGHAMVYRFKKKDEHTLIFEVINSGSGIRYHAQKSSTEKELFSPIKSFSIDLSTLDETEYQTELPLFIENLIRPNVSNHPDHPGNTFSSKTLYEEILPSISFLDGEEFINEDDIPEHGYTGSQLSGTCAERVIHQLLKLNFDSLEDYQHFILNYKIYALNDYLTKEHANLDIQLVKDTYRNNLRLYGRLLVAETLSEEAISSIEDALAITRRTIDTLDNTSVETEAPAPAPEDLNTKPFLIIPYNIHTVSPNTASAITKTTQERAVPIPPFQPDEILQQITHWEAEIKRLDAAGQKYAVMEQIENLMQALPNAALNSIVYNHLSPTELQDLKSKLDTLKLKYQSAQVKCTGDSKPPPKGIFVQFCFLALKMSIFKREHPSRSFSVTTQTKLFDALNRLKKQPYFATTHPDLDKAFNDKTNFFNSEYTYGNPLDYYQSMIDAHPALKERLKQGYQEWLTQRQLSHLPYDQGLHDALSTQGYDALWYMLHIRDIAPPEFEPICSELNQMENIEKGLHQFHTLAQQRESAAPSLLITLDSQTNTLKLNTPSNELTSYYLVAPNDHSVYPLKDSTDQCNVLGPFEQTRATNDIQLQPHRETRSWHKKSRSKAESLQLREMYHLRSNSDVQIQLTLDYFLRHLSHLNDKNMQQYLEANLFQPPLLLNCLKNNPAIINSFYRLIQNGMRATSKNGLPSQDSIFFIRLHFLLNRYLNGYDTRRYADKLSEFKTTLDDILTTTLDDEQIRYSLHHYSFLNAIEQYKKNESLDANFHQKTLASYFYLQAKSNPEQPHSLVENLELQEAFNTFQYLLQSLTANEIKACLPDTLNEIGLDTTSLTLVKSPPTFTFENPKTHQPIYQVDATHGLVYHGTHAETYVPTPLYIKNNPQCIALGLKHTSSCFTSSNQSYFYFPREDGDIRVIKDSLLDKPVIQKKWTINGEEHWYEQKTPSSFSEPKFEGYNWSHLPLDFSEYLLDDSISGWVKCKQPKDVLITQDNQPLFFADNTSSSFEEKIQLSFKTIDQNTNHTTAWELCHAFENNPTIKPLLQFEDANFLTVLYNQNTQMVQVKFERYGFSLEYQAEHPEIICLAGTNYVLSQTSSPFSSGVACLKFTNPDGSEKCMLPIQPFLSQKKEEGTAQRNTLKHDIKAATQYKRLKKMLGSNKKPEFNHHLSDQYIELPLNNGTPYANHPSDALYLTYLYLASDNPEKALETLNHCQNNLGGLRGTPEELTYLNWIINGLQGISKPSFVACQLRATALLTDFLATGKSIEEPDDVISDVETDDMRYQKQLKKDRQDFQTSLPALIGNLFPTYQRMLRHLPAAYQLEDTTCRSLLNYFESNSASKAYGALAYTTQYLDLKKLKKEQTHLESLRDTGQTLSSNQIERLATLDEHIQRAEAIAKTTTQLEQIKVNLDLPEECPTIQLTYPKEPSQLSENDINKALNLLNSTLSEDDLINHFGTYLAIACNSDSPPHIKEKLTLFCIRTLRQNRFIALSKQNTALPLLINLLYRVLTTQFENLDIKNNFKITSHNNTNTIPVSLESLFEQIKTWRAPPPIGVLQAVNTHQEVLATPDEILDDLSQEVHAPAPLTLHTVSHPHVSLHPLLDALNDTFKPFKSRYLQHQANHELAIKHLQRDITNTTPSEVLYELEKRAGEIEVRYLANQNQLALDYFQDKKETFKTLKTAVRTEHATCEQDIQTLWDDLLDLANQPPKDPKKAAIFALEIESSQRQLLDKQALYSLYIQGDLVHYTDKTNLSAEQIQELHQKIHQCLHHQLRLQHLDRLDTALNKAIETPDSPHATQAVVQQLMQENTNAAKDNSAYTFLQYEENILLRERQVEALRSLYPEPETLPKESIEKLIMGGGKSTVVLPLWAKKKANGSNLVILEVPRALLHTNHTDMNQTSFKWFGQRAHKFEFSRESDASPEALERLYEFFREVMANQDYLVTTGEAIQSLELKYLEILDKDPGEDQETWEKQVKSMDNIINLLKAHGHGMIDEVHQGLLTKQKLNYTSGKDQHIPILLIDLTVRFYQFLSPITWHNPEEEAFTLEQLIKNPRLVKNEAEWQSIAEAICNTLIESTDGPLKNIFHHYPNLTPEQIKAYIQNRLTPEDEPIVMAAIQDMFPNEQTMLAFYKTQLNPNNGVFQQTASRNYRVHYGPSAAVHKTAEERAMAIPYGGNDKPRESSQFANINESMNYTTQAMLIAGIERPLIIDLLRTWQAEAEAEFIENITDPTLTYAKTNAARAFADIMKDSPFKLGLGEIDLDSGTHIDAIEESIRANPWVIYEVLENYILPQITFNEETLSSNAYHHADIYHQLHGVSGTPANHKTFHQRLHYEPKIALGSDGLIIQTALKKESPIHAIDYTEPDAFLDSLLTQTNSRDDVHAIIDVCAMFQGQKNLDIATHIAEKLVQAGSRIQYVLYFDNEVLHAKPCDPSKAPIRLNTTNIKTINQILNCTPDERFTYYDQVHTTGTDIKQSTQSRGLVLIDHKTPLTTALQGTMRMRDFIVGEQSIDYIVPPVLAEYTDNLEGLMDKMATYEQHTLKTENFVSTLDKITSTIRNDLLKRLLAIENANPHQKQWFLHQIREVFFETHTQDYFEQYGSIIHEDTASAILERHKDNTIQKWRTLLEKTETEIPRETENKLTTILTDIINDILPHCDEKQLSANKSLDESAENELELHQHTEQHHQELREEAFANPNVTEAPYLYPLLRNLEKNAMSHFEINVFSEQLYLSKNFSSTYTEQKNTIFNAFVKPAHIILFSYEGDTLQACLITNQEFTDLRKQFNRNPSHNLWFSDLQGDCLLGEKPADIDSSEDYASLMEQVLFFNGDLDSLNRTARFAWMDQNPKEKCDFFEINLLPYRETKQEEFQKLKKHFERSAHLEVYQYISQNMYSPSLIDFNLKKINPDLTQAEIEIFQNLIKTLQSLQISWVAEKELNIQNFMLTHHLPKPAFNCVSQHYHALITLENIFNDFNHHMMLENQHETFEALCPLFKEHQNALKMNYDAHPETYLSPELYLLVQFFQSSYVQSKPLSLNHFFKHNTLTEAQCIELIQKSDDELIQTHAIKALVANLNNTNDAEQNIRIIESIMTHETFTAPLAPHLLLLKQGINTEKLLQILQKMDSIKDIASIINHPAFDASIAHYLFESHSELSASNLSEILNCSETLSPDMFEFIITHDQFNDLHVKKLLDAKAYALTTEQLKQIIDKQEQVKILDHILENPSFNTEVALHLLQTQATLTTKQLNQIIKTEKLSTDESIEQLIAYSNFDAVVAETVLKTHKNLNPEQLKTIIQKTSLNTDRSIQQLINHTGFDISVAEELLTTHQMLTPQQLKQVVRQGKLNESENIAPLIDHLNFNTSVAQDLLETHQTLTPIQLKQVIQKGRLNTDGAIAQLTLHPHFDATVAENLLETTETLTPRQLKRVIKKGKINTDKGIEQSINHSNFDTSVAEDMLETQPSLTQAQLKHVIKKGVLGTTKAVKKLLKHPHFDASLTEDLLGNTDTLTVEDLNQMINDSTLETDGAIENLIQHPNFDTSIANNLLKKHPDLTSNHLIQIIQYTKDKSIITPVRQHKKSNNAVIKAIFKQHNEIPETDLMGMIEAITSPALFYEALSSKHYTKAIQEKQLGKLNTNASNMANKAIQHNDKKLKLYASLQDLNLAAYDLTLKAIKNPKKYKKASEVVFVLHQTLLTSTTQYYNKDISAETYAKTAQKAIQEALPELQKHRGLKQLLYDIANVIAFILCIGRFILSGGQNLRFFEAKTEPEKIISDIKKNTPPDIQTK
ncbi:MAG: DUF3638 domain-containing protein [Gammaproteobacteria bacterium]|nr:DUF3638 domain-containing protein [Gammaproteobacteria bacterium]